jgi:hypothetical protein
VRDRHLKFHEDRDNLSNTVTDKTDTHEMHGTTDAGG